jgi:hypothetical protein
MKNNISYQKKISGELFNVNVIEGREFIIFAPSELKLLIKHLKKRNGKTK